MEEHRFESKLFKEHVDQAADLNFVEAIWKYENAIKVTQVASWNF